MDTSPHRTTTQLIQHSVEGWFSCDIFEANINIISIYYSSSSNQFKFRQNLQMTNIDEDDLISTLTQILFDQNGDSKVDGLEEDMVAYLAGLLQEGLDDNGGDGDDISETIQELMCPFLEGLECPSALTTETCQAIETLVESKQAPSATAASVSASASASTTRKLKQGMVSMSSDLDNTNDVEEDIHRYGWVGDSGIKAQVNDVIDAHTSKTSQKDRRKQRKELEESRRAFERLRMQQEEEESHANKGAVSAMVLPDYTSGRNERDIQVRNVSISLDNGSCLLDNGELKFASRRRYGLVGKNGVGKTTLLKAIASMSIEGFPKHLRVLHVRQELKSVGNDTSVLQAVMEADIERMALLKEEQELLKRLETEDSSSTTTSDTAATTTMSIEKKREQLLKAQKEKQGGNDDADDAPKSFDQDLKRLDEVYGRLQVISADSAEARASMILSGLQFTPDMQAGPTSALSGGWRMRVALAAALFIEPDLLMLDEPTNHLDLEAVLWLESYLVEYKHTLVVVSHDRGFLNEVCTDVIEFKDRKLTYYKGNYDTYVKTSDEMVKNTMRVYNAYQDKRAHLMEFIEKFRANAKRATMVQSRIKTVEKMDLEAPEPVEIEPLWRFNIPNPEPLGRPIIAVDDATFDYNALNADGSKRDESEFLLQKVNFGVDLDSRIGILGANGAGKSTLLNLIMGKIETIKGSVSRNGRLRIGHFTQHATEKFDLQLSSVENMLALFPDADDQEMRSFIGRFQIQGTDAVKPMLLLSGGQKSRVAFAALAYQKPHVIIMDEPTNHLDMESIDALVEAVKDFRGGLMVVSHDQYFITNTCTELWVVAEGHATRFRGDFTEYKKHTLEKTAKRVADSVKSLSAINN